MLNSIKLACSQCSSFRPSQARALAYTTSYAFGFNIFNNNSKKKTKRNHNKPLLSSKSSKAFFEGLLKGPDFIAVEQSIALTEANRLSTKALEYKNAKDYSQALTCYEMALSLIREHFEDDDPLVAMYYSKIGDVYQEKQDLPKAIDNYKISLDLMIESPEEDEVKVGKMYTLIGKCQIKERNYAEAIQNLEDALAIFKLEPEDNKKAINSCYSRLAESYFCIGKYEEALENFESLLGTKQHNGESPLFYQHCRDFAIALANGEQKYDEALLYLQKYLNRELSMNRGRSMSSADCYLKIGQVNSMQGRDKEAMEAYLKALEISKAVGGIHHKQTGSCYNTIGTVFLGQGKYNEAIEYFKMALNCFEGKDLETYACYKNIALTCFRQNHLETALTNFEHSIEGRSELLGELSEIDAEYAALHGMLASLYVRKGSLTEGLEHYEHFLEIFFKLFYQETVRSYEGIVRAGALKEKEIEE